MRPPVFIILAALILTLPACRRPPDKQLASLQGDWQVIRLTQGGKSTGAGPDKVWRFDGNKLIPLDNKDDVATVTLNSGATPATLDIVDKDGARDEGIYKLDGDTLLIAFSSSGSRPHDFQSDAGSKVTVIELKRVKK